MALSYFKWLLVPFLLLHLWPTGHAGTADVPGNWHPYFVTVTEINQNATDKTLEVTCKLFTDDFEKALADVYKTKTDLVQPAAKSNMDKLVKDYLQKHIFIKADGKPQSLTYVGFEQEKESVYAYFQVNGLPSVKQLEVNNSILHDLNENQVNIMHVTVNGKRKSVKLDYPKKTAVFQF